MIAKPFTRKTESLLSETRPTPAKAKVERSLQLAFNGPVDEDPDEIINRPFAEHRPRAHKVFTAINALDPGKDKDTQERLMKITQRLLDLSSYRPICLPGPDLDARIHHLAAMFPNFEKVTMAIVAVHARLLARGIEHRMPPVLLLGPPGVGKTVYAEAVGELLSAPVLRLDFASENSPSGLAGSSTFWANSSPGRLFNVLAFGEDRDPVANPVIFVDELDKASKNAQYDITNPLLRLLEKVSAEKFIDQSAPHVVVDTSQVRWILTANEIDGVSEPLRSRLVVFNIEPPTPDQAKRIAQNIANKTVQEFGVSGFYSRLTEKILAECAAMTPREARIRIEIAIGLAITQDLDCITSEVWHGSAVDEEPHQERRNAIGFL